MSYKSAFVQYHNIKESFLAKVTLLKYIKKVFGVFKELIKSFHDLHVVNIARD